MKRLFIVILLVLFVSILFPIGVSAHNSDVSLYTIRVITGAGGSISPSGTLIIFRGESVTYTITPDVGYRIFCVWIDNKPYGTISHYTFRNIKSNHTIVVKFIKKWYR